MPPGAPSTVELVPGSAVVVAPRALTALALRRYSAVSFPIDLGEIVAASPAEIRIPADGSDVPWTLAVTSEAPAGPAPRARTADSTDHYAFTVRTVRNIAIIAVLALIVAVVPGGGNAARRDPGR